MLESADFDSRPQTVCFVPPVLAVSLFKQDHFVLDSKSLSLLLKTAHPFDTRFGSRCSQGFSELLDATGNTHLRIDCERVVIGLYSLSDLSRLFMEFAEQSVGPGLLPYLTIPGSDPQTCNDLAVKRMIICARRSQDGLDDVQVTSTDSSKLPGVALDHATGEIVPDPLTILQADIDPPVFAIPLLVLGPAGLDFPPRHLAAGRKIEEHVVAAVGAAGCVGGLADRKTSIR